MKRIISLITITIFYLVLTENDALAQPKEYDVAYTANSYLQQYKLPGVESTNASYTNDINLKAKRDFSKSFENITDEKWYTLGNGFFAVFNKDQIKTEVYYNKKGLWLYNFLTYNQDQLTPAVKDMIKSEYKDYGIFVAYEYQFYDGPVYIVKMKNANSYKTVLVADGETRVIESFTSNG